MEQDNDPNKASIPSDEADKVEDKSNNQ